MQRYRFPGLVPVPKACNEKKEPKPFIIVRSCPRRPYVQDHACRANIYDRAVVRRTSDNPTPGCGIPFILETFRGNRLIVKNLDRFCGYNFADGDIVAVSAEEIKNCRDDERHRFLNEEHRTIDVNAFKITRVWKNEIRHARGTVIVRTDSNNQTYYAFRQVVDMTTTTPYRKTIDNPIFTQTVVIFFEIVNILGVCNAQQALSELVGVELDITYVDYGEETKERVGVPIVITSFNPIVFTPV